MHTCFGVTLLLFNTLSEMSTDQTKLIHCIIWGFFTHISTDQNQTRMELPVTLLEETPLVPLLMLVRF